MKKYLLISGLLLMALGAGAQKSDSSLTEQTVREKILSDIQTNLTEKTKATDSTIIRLDRRVSKIDSIIKVTGNPKERIDKLLERVQILEERQKAIEENELSTYQANYQSALINLTSMDREIKPLILFRTTKDFFNALTETSNPVNYPAFEAGYGKFKTYMDRCKDNDATLKTVSDIVAATGNVSFDVPLVGAYSQLLFSAMAKYINSIGHRKRELKAQAEKMFAVTTALSQFTTDKNMIEHEWDGITQSLEEMQVHYDSTLNRNLRMVNINRDEFTNEFTRQSDANKRYLYLTMLRDKAAAYVVQAKKDDPKNWKENIYYQLMDVQSLKMKYGDITYHIEQHINKYDVLIKKYKSNKDIGDKVAKLEEKLNELKETFDSTFEPSEYVQNAARMYRVM